MEHLQHFGLRQDPFQNEPDLRFFFESACHSACQQRLERGLRQNKGMSVLTGEAGTGKTLLSRRILESLEEELFDAHLMVILPGASDASSVLGRFARMIGVEEAAADRPALLGQVYESLAIVREEGRSSVLILDDSQLLERDALAEIGSLLNLEYEDRRLISLLLVGLPKLDVTLSHEASLGPRVEIRTRLDSLDLRNSAAYLLHRLTMVGGAVEILPEEAMSTLFKFSRGRPRLLNTLADNGLFEAYLAGRKSLSSTDVERAAQDLGIGIEPGNTYTSTPPSALPTQSEQSYEPMAPVAGVASAIAAGSDLADASLGELSPETSALDIGDLLDSGGSPDTEMTTLMPMPGESSGCAELDEAVEDVLGAQGDLSASAQSVLDGIDAGLDDLPIFEGHNATDAASAEATRVALPEEETAGGDEFDDLFVELLEE